MTFASHIVDCDSIVLTTGPADEKATLLRHISRGRRRYFFCLDFDGTILVNQKGDKKKSQTTCDALSTMAEFAGKHESMSSLNVHRRIQAFKICSSTFKIDSTSI
mmetsp:Transcript_27922/g.76848  ORF Transcript_27922/g.76848 Transcript_27922/m.76848 type:complete len:105 (-) Transcript_27922:1133-1447(-)